MLQLNGGELFPQICQTARPIEFEPAPGRTMCALGRSVLRQKLDESFHLLPRRDGQRIIFGEQRVFAHNRITLLTNGKKLQSAC